MKSKKHRNTKGSTVEFTAIVPVFALFILVPMLNLGTVTLRTTFITLAARDAVHRAIKAHSFEADIAGEPSAKTIARTAAIDIVERFGGVEVRQVVTRIVTTPVNGTGDPERHEHPLPASPEPDTKTTVYQLEVEVDGEVAPLLSAGGLFANVPGLSKPFPFKSLAREIFEDPSALTL